MDRDESGWQVMMKISAYVGGGWHSEIIRIPALNIERGHVGNGTIIESAARECC